jgi:hypothetical protein
LQSTNSQMSQQYPSRIRFIIPGWRGILTLFLNFFFNNRSVCLFKRELQKFVTIMVYGPNQQQVTPIHAQAGAIMLQLL